jgi:hypothetical protein
MSSYNLIEEIEKFQNTYYSQGGGKNTIFKKSQKIECASQISSNFDIQLLLNKTIYLIQNTNKIFIDYTVFKLYGNPSNYKLIIDRLFTLFLETINTYGEYECHINLNTFTISAAERYKQVIEMFCSECLQNKTTRYSLFLSKMHIYNSPSMLENIAKLFAAYIEPSVRTKIEIHNKSDSNEKINYIHANISS